MAKKNNDPFAEFAKKIVNAPKVSEVEVPVQEEAATTEKAISAPSPTGVKTVTHPKIDSTEKKILLRDDHKAVTVYLRNDLITKLKTSSFKTGMSVKAIVNQALDEYFDKHKGIL